MPKKLKVFHGLVNYGTQAGLFAHELRHQGIEAISVVGGDKAKRQIDIELLHGGNFIQKVFRSLWNRVRKYYWFFKYNTFHFYFGKTLFKNQIDLPLYKFFGKKVVMEYLGNDIRNYKILTERYDLPKSHEYYQHMEEHDNKISRRIINEKKYLDYTLCCLPSHFRLAESYDYKIDELLPLAIDLKKIKYFPLQEKKRDESFNVLHAPTSRLLKGTKFIIDAIEQLKKDGNNVNLTIAEGITHDELLEEYKKCDIFIAQIGLGWYGTVALESMATGRPTCAYIDEGNFQYIDYAAEIPVINVTRENVTDKLQELMNNRKGLPEIGRKSREFVEKYHDVKNVTKKLIDIYQNKVWQNF